MKKFIFETIVEIEAETREDAAIELIRMMDEHSIYWGNPVEEEE